MRTGCGKLYITINHEKSGEPIEVLGRMGKSGGCVTSQIEGLGRLISCALQNGAEPKEIIKQLKGIRCPSPEKTGDMEINSCADAFAKALEWDMKVVVEETNGHKCPKCKTDLKKVKNSLVCECGFERSD